MLLQCEIEVEALLRCCETRLSCVLLSRLMAPLHVQKKKKKKKKKKKRMKKMCIGKESRDYYY